jgi:hypothetical protein
MRLERDAAHRITMELLALIDPCFRTEELYEFYQEAMPIVMNGLHDYARRAAREKNRIKGRQEGHE